MLLGNMTNIYVILFFCLQLTWVAAEITWENCDSNSDSIRLLNLTVKPYPIIIPGSLSIEITIHNNQEITSPLKTELTLQKKILFGYISVPCISGIGSCTYNDLCTMCPQCGCPLKAGDHVINLPITIDIDTWALLGNYQALVSVETGSGQKGCVKVNHVYIQSKQ